MRVVFLGTADFAIPSLESLYQAKDIELLALVCQADKPVGRKKIITAPATKSFCLEQGYDIAIFQPEKISSDENFIAEIKKLKPDLLITAAYGQILRQNILDLAPRGVINLHASLLPEFRGPAPINWMIIHGEKEVGVTTMQTDLGVDTGDILLKAATELADDESAVDLGKRLSQIGAELLLKTLRDIDQIKPQKQELSGIEPEKILAPFMDRNLGMIDFKQPYLELKSANKKQSDFLVRKRATAQNIYNLFRGLSPWPGTAFYHQDKKISLLDIKVSGLTGEPGEIIATDKSKGSICIACQEASIEIFELKPEGKNSMSALAWYNGLK